MDEYNFWLAAKKRLRRLAKHAMESCFAVGKCIEDLVSWSECGVGGVFVFKLHSVTEVLGPHLLDVTVMHTIVHW